MSRLRRFLRLYAFWGFDELAAHPARWFARTAILYFSAALVGALAVLAYAFVASPLN